MKKSILATSVALSIGVTSSLVGGQHHNAHAAEQSQINKAELAQKAQSNDTSINTKPIQAGSYDYKFDLSGFTYHFWSDGQNFGYDFKETGKSSVQKSYQNNVNHQDTQKQAQFSNVSKGNQSPNEQTQSYTQSNEQNQPQKSSVSNSSKQPSVQNVQTTQASAKQVASTSSSSSTSIPSHLQMIKQRESGGDYSAINPSSGAAGAYQFMQGTWDSVAPAEWKGKSPASAPASVQDAAAVKLYNNGSGASHWVTA